MGKTFRQPQHKSEDEQTFKRGKKSLGHTSGKKLGGMRIINDPFFGEGDDYFDDDVNMTDDIVINKYSDDNT